MTRAKVGVKVAGEVFDKKRGKEGMVGGTKQAASSRERGEEGSVRT